MTNTWRPSSTKREWEDARRAAFVQDILGAITRRQADLLPFEQVQQGLHLRDVRYLGLVDVPLDHIVGSVGRYRDFTRAFFPRQGIAHARWLKIARLAAAMDSSLPPIELLKVGDAYFVRDGNHRVSVARQRKMPSIQAYVWEYETRVPLELDTTPEALLNKAAYADFLDRTNVDCYLCDDMCAELSQPDGYADLLHEIHSFQHSLSQLDGRDVPFDEAVALWCEMAYTPIVEIIRAVQILDEFPGRTEADLYLWLCRNQKELELRYGQPVLIEEAAGDLAERFGQRPTPARQVRGAVGRVVDGVEGLGSLLVKAVAADDRVQDDDRQAAALLAPIRRAAETTPPFRFRGTGEAEWAAWRAGLCDRLWDLLGAGDRPWQPYGPDALDARIRERVSLDGDGLVRELVWLNVEPELRVPLYLFHPQEAGAPRPAIVVLPGHGTMDQTAGLEDSSHQAGALALARAGFLVLTPELRGFGRLAALSHLQIDAAARLVGRTWLGLSVQDAMRAVDYLLTRPEVDPARIGAAGLGVGGGLAMYLAALDERVRVAFVGGYLGKYAMASLDEERCPCNDIPGILCCAEMGDVAALIAPRPVLFVNGRRDPGAGPGVRESFAIVCHLYQTLGVPRRAELIQPEGLGYLFDNQLAAGWFQRWLD